MPLMSMSPNIPELDPSGRKRNHGEYSENIDGIAAKAKSAAPVIKMEPTDLDSSLPAPRSPPPHSSPAVLTEDGSSTPRGDSTAPISGTSTENQPFSYSTMPPATGSPAAQTHAQKKRKVEDCPQPATEQQKEELRKQKAEDKQKKLDEKAKKKEEREQKRLEKEQEKEQKRLEKEREVERKIRAQPRIANFFKKDSAPLKQAQISIVTAKSATPTVTVAQTEYARLAQPFFVKEHVKLAKSPFAMDEETKGAKSTILDDYMTGRRPPAPTNPFKPSDSLHLVASFRRGKSYPCVKELMVQRFEAMSNPLDLLSQQLGLQNTQDALKAIPIKQLSFHEDVRPGWYGTVTSVHSPVSLRKLAKNPIAKELHLNYDYDSEAEWVQGDDEPEDGEDLSDEENDDEDDAESMDEFLDDSEDSGRHRGPAFQATLEPDSSGICFEDEKSRNPNIHMNQFRMEVMIPNLESAHSIDPFSAAYWLTEPNAAALAVYKQTCKIQSGNGVMPPPPAPKAAAIAASSSPPNSTDLVPAHQVNDFKAAILEFKFLPKAALLPTLKKKFDRCTSGQIKNSLEHFAEKPTKKGDWQLRKSM